MKSWDYVFVLVATAAAAALAWASNATIPTSPTSLWDLLLVNHRMALIITLSVLNGVATIAQPIRAAWKQRQARKEALAQVLEQIHARTWVGGKKSIEHRLSLFQPKRVLSHWLQKRLVCVWRTDGDPTKKSWPLKPQRRGKGQPRKLFGFVSQVWSQGSAPLIAALAPSASDAEIQLYCDRTHIDRDTYDKLSWRGAAMSAIQVVVDVSKGPIAVLLVERRATKGGEKIDRLEGLYQDANICGILMKGD
jgi:hypothetical protein